MSKDVDITKFIPVLPIERDWMTETRDQLRTNIGKLGQDFNAQFADINKSHQRPRLAEHIFRNVFLPYFAKDEKRAMPDIDLGNWVAFAGSPYTEVDVVDDVGTILFVVPPAMDNSGIQPGVSNGRGPGSFNHVMRQTRLYENTIPVEAERYLGQELTQRASNMKHDFSNVVKNIKAWNEIFKRYERPLIPLPGLPTEPTKGASQVHDDDDSDYDFVAP